MTYPAVLLVLSVAVVILIVTFILPQFQSLFDEMDSLPWITNMLIAISDFLVQRWYVALLAVFIFVALVRLIMGIPAVRRGVDYAKVPVSYTHLNSIFQIFFSEFSIMGG